MPKGTYRIPGFCVVCSRPIPSERLTRGGVTCSKECTKTRRDAQRAQQDEVECRQCRKPSTPEQRDAYRRFHKMETKRPDLLYPEQFEAWTASGGEATPEAFATALKEGFTSK
jgi:hypothetical protein